MATDPSDPAAAFAFAAADASPSLRAAGGGRSKVVKRGGRHSTVARGKAARRSGTVTAMAIGEFVYGAMQLMCGGIFLFAGLVMSVASAGLDAGQNTGTAEQQFGTMFGALGAMALLIGLLSFLNGVIVIVAGIGVLARAAWGRVLSLVGASIAALYVVLNLVLFAMSNGNDWSAILGILIHAGFAGWVFGVLLTRSAASEFH